MVVRWGLVVYGYTYLTLKLYELHWERIPKYDTRPIAICLFILCTDLCIRLDIRTMSFFVIKVYPLKNLKDRNVRPLSLILNTDHFLRVMPELSIDPFMRYVDEHRSSSSS